MFTIYDKCTMVDLMNLLQSRVYNGEFEGPGEEAENQVIFVTPDNSYTKFSFRKNKVESTSKSDTTIIELYPNASTINPYYD